MLTQLSIKNLAITQSLSLEFNQGLSVLTGETGAGKSIIIDAIGLVLGDRADPCLIKTNEKRADIIASFEIDKLPELTTWLEQHDLDSEGECILKRSLHDNGRSKGFINAQPVPLTLLKQLGEKLISIHGQNSHQQLLHSDTQLSLLDEYARLTQTTDELNNLYHNWHDKNALYEKRLGQSDELEQKKQFLQFQLEELQNFSPFEGEFEELDIEYKILSHSKQIMLQLSQVQQQLSECEEYNAESLLASANKNLADLIDFDSQLKTIYEMTSNALIVINEANGEISQYLQAIDENPERLAELEERLSQYHELSRKHQVNSSQLFIKMTQLEAEYLNYAQSDGNQAQLVSEITILKNNYFKLAESLSKKRSLAATKLATEVEKNIHQLGLSQGRFSIELISSKNKSEELLPKTNGLETVHFMISANPGQKSAPISKVASDGELSRISLAIQVVTAQYKSTPSLIFDEIDVGVGGKIAEMIGAKLSQLGQQSQILCVTHQAQVAVHGKTHYLVEKSFAKNSTSSNIIQLDETQRIDELSRMLSGANITQTTRLHATEMLQYARE